MKEKMYNWDGKNWEKVDHTLEGKFSLKFGILDGQIAIELDSLLSMLWKSQLALPKTREVLGPLIDFLASINEQLKER